MPLNLIKKYPALLEIMHLDLYARINSLRLIFNRDIQNNKEFKFQQKIIRPLKIDGIASMGTLFNHLIKEEIKKTEDSKIIKRRVFEKDRAERLHWIFPHINLLINEDIKVFSVEERDKKNRKNIIRTYVYNSSEKYVIVLQPQNSNMDYYLLSAYYLNKKWAIKAMKKKLKNKLDEVY